MRLGHNLVDVVVIAVVQAVDVGKPSVPACQLPKLATHKGTFARFTVRAEDRSSTLLRAAELLAEALTYYECGACEVFYVS
jgi:hypothetical protein